jgi:hypothetical protein
MKRLTQGGKRLECLTTDARGPSGVRLRRDLLAGRKAAGVGIARPDD